MAFVAYWLTIMSVLIGFGATHAATTPAPAPGGTCPDWYHTGRCDLSTARRITIKVCDGWRAYQVGTDLVIVCPGQAVPGNGIVMRPYYSRP